MTPAAKPPVFDDLRLLIAINDIFLEGAIVLTSRFAVLCPLSYAKPRGELDKSRDRHHFAFCGRASNLSIYCCKRRLRLYVARTELVATPLARVRTVDAKVAIGFSLHKGIAGSGLREPTLCSRE